MQIKDISLLESINENLDTWCYEVGSCFEKFSVDSAQEMIKYLKKENNKKRILDLGSGDGAATNEFLRQEYLTLSLDVNEEKLNKVEAGGVTVCIDALEFMHRVGYVDNIFTHHSLEHMVNAEEIILLIGEKMTEGSLYYAAVPAEDYLHSVHHVVFESPEELLPPNCEPLLLDQRERYEEKEFICIARKM